MSWFWSEKLLTITLILSLYTGIITATTETVHDICLITETSTTKSLKWLTLSISIWNLFTNAAEAPQNPGIFYSSCKALCDEALLTDEHVPSSYMSEFPLHFLKTPLAHSKNGTLKEEIGMSYSW